MRVISGDDAPVTTFASGPSLSRARYEVLMRLTHADAPSTIADLEQSTGRHPNTLREHVDALIRLGLARRIREAPQGPGRPAWRYAALCVDEIRTEYAALVADLVELTERQARRPGAEAEATGLRWGIHLAREMPTPTADLAPACLLALLVDLGFQPPLTSGGAGSVVWPGWDDGLAWRVHAGVAQGVWKEWGATGAAPQLRSPEKRTDDGVGPQLVLG